MNKINQALIIAKKYGDMLLTVTGEETPEQAAQFATAWAVIAIAEALLEQNQQAKFQTEVEEMRQERLTRDDKYLARYDHAGDMRD